jgi:probable rRNA maturation factor
VVVVEIANRQRRWPVDRARIEAVARRTHAAAGGEPGGISILLTADRVLRGLNRRFRGVDRSTDVLSFPDGSASPEGGAYLGDMAISVETAAGQAERAGCSLAAELDRLVVHGVLHLLGYDHEVDGGEMMALQRRILRSLRRRGMR